MAHEPEVVLVDEADRPIGVMEKFQAHRTGVLHRAFSVMIFDHEGRVLLQQRAKGKYHSGGLWSNACCSHPSAEGSLVESAIERLWEEMGIRTSLRPHFNTRYNLDLGDGMIENELDHVFIGICEDTPRMNPDEVKDAHFANEAEIEDEMKRSPEKFTEWFKVLWKEHRIRRSIADEKDACPLPNT